MPRKDEFDDPQSEGALRAILRSMEKRGDSPKRGPLFTIVPLALMVLILVGVLWYSYPKEAAEQEQAATPIVRADAADYKVEPTDPGGMEIPYRESTVFDTLREKDEQGDKKIENLLPESETPMDRKELFAGLKTELKESAPPGAVPAATPDKTLTVKDTVEGDRSEITAPAVTVEEVVEETNVAPPSTPLKPAPEPVMPAMATKGEKKAEEVAAVSAEKAPAAAKPASKDVVEKTPEPSTPAVTAKAPAAAPKATAPQPVKATEISAVTASPVTAAAAQAVAPAAGAASGTHYIQLGSVKAREGAQAFWQKAQADSPAQLSALTLRIQEANLGDKGTFYRVQGGPVDEARAKSICTSLNAKKAGSCLSVKK